MSNNVNTQGNVRVPGRLKQTAIDEHGNLLPIAGASDIYDDTNEMTQAAFNAAQLQLNEEQAALNEELRNATSVAPSRPGPYDDEFNGMEKVYLTKNVEEDVETGIAHNYLTQAMFQHDGEPIENAIFVINYDYELAENITVPSGCVLKFEGGSIGGNKTLTGNQTFLSGDIKCFVAIAGTFSNDSLDITWFGAKGDDNTECVTIFNNVFTVCVASGIDMFVPEGVFAFKGGRFFPLGENSYNAGEDTSKYLDCKNVTIKGCYKKSVIKSYNNGDVLNLAWLKNLNLKDLTITSGITSDPNDWGTNLISLIDVENVTIDGCWCHDSYWKWRNATPENPANWYADGGDGITLQGKVYHNVKITNCEIENCDRGLDIGIEGGNYTSHPGAHIYVANVLIKKCYSGFVYGQYNYQEDHDFTIQGGLTYIQVKCVNCLQSTGIAYPVGMKAHIHSVQEESYNDLLLSGYGESWFKDIPLTTFPKDIKAAFAGSLKAFVNSNIEIEASAVELNYGFIVDPGGTRGTSHQYVAANSIINLSLNKDTTIVPVVNETGITDEKRFYYHTSPDFNGYIDKCFFIFNNLEVDDWMVYYTANNNCVFVVDGKIMAKTILTKELIAYAYDNSHNVAGKLITQNGIFAARNKISSNEFYMAFAISGGNDGEEVLRLGFNGYGDICRPEFDTDIVNGVMSSMRAGGYFIPVRKMGDISNIFGNIPVYKGNTKGTTQQRPDYLTQVEAGHPFFDTDLGKPIWWDGTQWVDASGTPVS